MNIVHALLVSSGLLLLGPCGCSDAGTTTPAGNGDPGAVAPGGGAVPPPNGTGGGGTGGRCKATGAICPIFTSSNGWEFRTATTYYTDGKEPRVSSMSGKAVFNADGTFVEDYTVGALTITNHYEGTYALDGRFFTGTAAEGEKLEYILACDEPLKGLAITFPNADCSPSLIVGLKLIEK